MRLIQRLIPIIITLGLSTAQAVDTCSALFVSWSNVHSFVEDYRHSHILPLSENIPKEESGFIIQGKLGESTAKVYLGIDPNTKTSVVVKRQSTISMFCRELMVTDYLLENGETVPKILKAAIKSDSTTVIVREYFKGLTGEELANELKSSNPSLPPELSNDAWQVLDLERERLENLFENGDGRHPPFKAWYLANFSRLVDKYHESWNAVMLRNLQDPQLVPRIYDILFIQDFGRSNLLFDIERDRWVAFDP